MIKVSENYKKAFVELEAVLKCLNYDDYNKIPKNLINEIEQNKDKEYKYEYNETLEYYKWNFMPETKALLYNIFKKFSSLFWNLCCFDCMLNVDSKLTVREKIGAFAEHSSQATKNPQIIDLRALWRRSRDLKLP